MQPPVGGVDAREVVDVEEEERDRLRDSLVGRRGDARGALRPRRTIGDRGEGVIQQWRLARLDASGEGCGRGDAGDGDPLANDVLEDLEDGRVELTPHVAAHDVERFVMGQRGLERAAREEGVVDVGDGEDARRQWDLLPGQPVRIAGAIPAFVVRLDDRAHFPRGSRRRAAWQRRRRGGA